MCWVNVAYYDTSGAITGCAPPTYCLTNTGPFSNMQWDNYYWAMEYAPDTNYAWDFNMGFGLQGAYQKTNNYYAWAVLSGDVISAVPVPAAVWLFGSGLLGLLGIARRKAG